MSGDLLTVADVAARLGVSRATMLGPADVAREMSVSEDVARDIVRSMPHLSVGRILRATFLTGRRRSRVAAGPSQGRVATHGRAALAVLDQLHVSEELLARYPKRSTDPVTRRFRLQHEADYRRYYRELFGEDPTHIP